MADSEVSQATAADEVATVPVIPNAFEVAKAANPVHYRLITAALWGIAQYGYKDCTVAQIVARARTSRRAFYEHFADREDCLLAGYELATDALLEQLAQARSQVHRWPDRPLAGLDCYLQSVAAAPGLGRAFLVEIHRSSPAADERRMGVHWRWAQWLSRETETDLILPGPAGVPRRSLSPLQALAVIAGQAEILADSLLTGRSGEPDVRQQMAFLELSAVTSPVPGDLTDWQR